MVVSYNYEEDGRSDDQSVIQVYLACIYMHACNYYPKCAWAATGIVVCLFVCLSQVYLYTHRMPQRCVYSMYSLHRTIYLLS